MKRLLCVVLGVSLLTTGVWAAPAQQAAPVSLNLQAASAVLMEKETGTLLYEQNPHEQLEPASVTKIMTLLLIFEAIDSGRISREDMVTISAYAAGMGGSQVYLKEGETMSVEEMLKCVIIASANDC
ncbi:MAG: D-alanyl-D-alanine carboxypeptidase, partial [Oscillibacter sp.]|nr:D-alanyl-D-alanine carboxypeptidase [Oscillibacter sp.]